MKTMAFTINSQNIERAIGIQATFIMEKKLQKVHVLAKKSLSFMHLVRPL